MNPSKTSSTRLHGLDTLRAGAIVLVILYHLRMQGLVPEALAPIAKIGWVGVDLFFVLSGFLIGCQLLKPYVAGGRPSLMDFYERRAYRILPAFLVVFLFYVFVPVWREAPGPYAAWQYVSFSWNLLLLGYPEHRAFSHVWSLCVEEHFYLIFPAVVLLLMRKPSATKTIALTTAIFFAGLGIRAWVLHHVLQAAGEEQGLLMMRYIYYPTYSRLDGLLVGITLAVVRTFRAGWWARMASYSSMLAVGGVACAIAGLWFCGFEYPASDLPLSILFAFPALACGFGLLVASAASEAGLLARRVPGASALAGLAYSLYLTHKSVAHAVHLLLPGLIAESDWRSFCICCLLCLGVAWLLHSLVERPMIELRMRRSVRVAKADNGMLAETLP